MSIKSNVRFICCSLKEMDTIWHGNKTTEDMIYDYFHIQVQQGPLRDEERHGVWERFHVTFIFSIISCLMWCFSIHSILVYFSCNKNNFLILEIQFLKFYFTRLINHIAPRLIAMSCNVKHNLIKLIKSTFQYPLYIHSLQRTLIAARQTSLLCTVAGGRGPIFIKMLCTIQGCKSFVEEEIWY